MTPVELMGHLQARRSVRQFSDEVPSRELLEQLVGAAITAPSASNKQPWRFFIVLDPARIAALAEAVKAAVERVAKHVEPTSRAGFRGYGSYFWRFEDAPALIVPLCRRLTLLSHMVASSLPAEDRACIDALETRSGLMGTSMALQNLLLMAPTLGLGASGMTGPLLAKDEIRAQLGVPPSWEIACLVPVGFPAEKPSPTPRRLVEKVIRWIES
jgi:coenzyme F420-0:L-glutamate ligase/coenzyme F420-1:gamma-L-glutamate ligase